MQRKVIEKIAEEAKAGFTLVELLVVVAIIGILGAVAVQNVTQHIAKTRIVATQEAIATIGQALTTYSLDHNGKFPDQLATLTEGDTMTAYNNETGKYNAWELQDNGTWKAVQSAGGAETQEADEYAVPRGAAVWVTRQDPTQPLYLVGEVSEKSAETPLEPAPSDDTKSWNLVASPSVEPTKVEDILAGNENVDAIMVPTDGAPKVYIYRDGKWGYETTEEVIRGGKVVGVRSVFKTDDTEIPAGTGFWYLNGSTDDNKTVEW